MGRILPVPAGREVLASAIPIMAPWPDVHFLRSQLRKDFPMRKVLCAAIAVIIDIPDDNAAVCAPLAKSPLDELAARLARKLATAAIVDGQISHCPM